MLPFKPESHSAIFTRACFASIDPSVTGMDINLATGCLKPAANRRMGVPAQGAP